ncbi:DUF3226 domain-containing protein [Spirosoma flavum]|uniref:DUF3226 domain-containing protein n=1 Tax=Spirosoma flavum TaxID=2048557 RepID=A0ABW6ADR9_9BACT
MSKIKILVEGIADAKFLQDLINEWYTYPLGIASLGKLGDIIHLDGKDAFDSANKLEKLSILFEQADFLGIPVIVIFDADHYPDNHLLFSSHSQTHGFTFFLLPNNEADGDLETLLQTIIHPENQIIFDCWQAYESCLNGKKTAMTETGLFTLPARKTKIYAYLEALVGESGTEKEKIKERQRDYRNENHWNLDPTYPTLKPLKEFLDPFFSIQ